MLRQTEVFEAVYHFGGLILPVVVACSENRNHYLVASPVGVSPYQIHQAAKQVERVTGWFAL